MRRFSSLDEAHAFLSSLVFSDVWSIYCWTDGAYSCFFVVPNYPDELRFLSEYFPEAKEVV